MHFVISWPMPSLQFADIFTGVKDNNTTDEISFLVRSVMLEAHLNSNN